MGLKVDGHTIASILRDSGIVCCNVTRSSLQVKTDNPRVEEIDNILHILKKYGAVHDLNVKGSSIGGILVQGVKILIKLFSKTNVLAYEELAIKQLNAAITFESMTISKPVTIKCQDVIYKDIVKCESTPGTPKSDFHLINANGEEVLWISHKKGNSAKDFQQWGGITEHPISTEYSNLFEDVTNIIKNDLKNEGHEEGVIPPGTSYIFKNIPHHLKMLSVYGVEYGHSMSRQNVTVVMQGNISLKNDGDYCRLISDGHAHYNSDGIEDQFEPGIAVVYKGDRSQLGLKGARATISPTGGRTYKREFTL